MSKEILDPESEDSEVAPESVQETKQDSKSLADKICDLLPDGKGKPSGKGKPLGFVTLDGKSIMVGGQIDKEKPCDFVILDGTSMMVAGQRISFVPGKDGLDLMVDGPDRREGVSGRVLNQGAEGKTLECERLVEGGTIELYDGRLEVLEVTKTFAKLRFLPK